MKFATVPEMFLRVCEKNSGTKSKALTYKENDEWKSITHDQLRHQVECFALGLLELGVHPGDRIGIVSENRMEWIIADLAIASLGAVDVPLFSTLTPRQEEYIFKDCNASYIIVSNNFQLSKTVKFKQKLDRLRHVIVMNEKFDSDDLSVKSMKELMQRGKTCRNHEERRRIFEKYCGNVTEDDLLTLIYTSGTTGDPKGVMLTHINVISNVISISKEIDISESDIFLSFLPLNHSYERATGYYTAFSSSAEIALAESVETVASSIGEIQPTLMTTVPKLLETVKRKIFSNIEKENIAKQKMFHWAVDIGRKYIRARQQGKYPMLLRTQYNLADRLVFRKIREKIDPRLRMFISGGAALPPDVCEFFLAIGIKVLEGYGLTEASPVITVNTENDIEIGTIGKPIAGVEVKIAEDGELLARGPNIMKGYWKNPEATEDTIDNEGWLHTGDIAEYTDKGNLKITDRKKHIFVNTGGKNIAPMPIENLLAQSKYIDQCFLVGDKREFCTALIIPDFEQLAMLADRTGVSYESEADLTTNRDIIYQIHKDIDHLQKDLAKFERVRRFTLLDRPFSVEEGELSPKMSVKRHIVEEKYAELINTMYGGR